jgi:DNA-directed RNA polymerase subunit RPC12/RpoP
MATVTDQQQMKGNLGGPDLFLAPIGRLDSQKITKYFCNTCEKEFEGPPKIEYENPNEEVAENLVLAEKGQYICNSCTATIAEYREFKKQNETAGVGIAKPLETPSQATQISEPVQTKPESSTIHTARSIYCSWLN